MTKTYFTTNEIIEDLIETLEGYNNYYCNLHDVVFNSDPYIMNRDKAEEALIQYGLFHAIEKIREYEQNIFGEVITDLSDPEKVATMLYYTLSDQFITETFEFNAVLDEASEESDIGGFDVWNTVATEEINKYLINKLIGMKEEEAHASK